MPKHLAFPLRRAGRSLATVVEDSDVDVVQSVSLLLDTRPGERRSVPDYGLPDPLFGRLDPAQVRDVVRTWEERADVDQLDIAMLARS